MVCTHIIMGMGKNYPVLIPLGWGWVGLVAGEDTTVGRDMYYK